MMQLPIPLTGTLLSYNPPTGDPNDPVRIINIDLGNVSWQLISLDLEHDLALLDVTPADEGDFILNGQPTSRPLTLTEKQALLDTLKVKVQSKTIGQLYQETKSPRLRKPK